MHTQSSTRREDFESAMARGHREYLRGRYDLAITAYTQAIEASARPVAYLLRAAAYQRVGESEKAETDRKTAESLP